MEVGVRCQAQGGLGGKLRHRRDVSSLGNALWAGS